MSVTSEVRGRVRVAVMDDGKANALSFDMIEKVRAEVKAAADAGLALVLAGRPGYFCAGFDLTVIRGDDDSRRKALGGAGADLFRDMLTAPVPIVVACTGHALAAGALLLLSADYRLGSTEQCRIGLNEVAIGMALPPFAMAMARHRLAPARLTRATLLAEVGAPLEAVDIGYLDGLADPVVDAAVARAEVFAALPARPFSVTKQRLWAPLLAEIMS